MGLSVGLSSMGFSHKLQIFSAGFLSFVFIFTTSGCVTNRRSVGEDSAEGRSMQQKLASLRADGPRKRILLLPMLNDTPEKDPAIAKTARETLVAGLRLTDNFIILDNNDVQKDLKQFKKENGYDIEEVARVGAELGVLAIIEARILQIKAKTLGDDVGIVRSVKAQVDVSVGVRVYATINRKEVLNEVRAASSEAKSTKVGKITRGDLMADPALTHDALASAFQGMILPITKSVDKLNWVGKVAYMNGEKIYVNAGRLTGLNIGDILRVTEASQEVYDPDSGVLIGKAPGRMKGTLEVVSYFGKDGAVTVVHSGQGFKENDRVELY
jgi:hypothetical protein